MGKLVITAPWPGMMQTVYKDRKRFIDTYFQKYPVVILQAIMRNKIAMTIFG